jgi:two-component system cell cycle sensor histidine kinase/response regulator CckA
MQTTLSAKPPKVLVVEDEGLIAHDISTRLQALGHEVAGIASTAREAIEKAAGADIVLMDIHLDGPGDGVAAATEIRQRHRIPVVFLTGQADRITLERAKLADPFGYIVKPLTPASLDTSIEIALYRHRTERQLEEREAWLRTILGSIGEAVLVTDPDGRVLMLNLTAEALTGCGLNHAQGQPIWKVARLVHHDFEDAPAEPVALAILRDQPVPLDRNWRLIARDGREILIEGTVAPVKVAGRAIGAVLSFRDMSARDWEERQLRQFQKMEAAGRLAAGIATDYASLLAIIRNQAEQLLQQSSDYSPARRAAEEIQRAAAAAERINRRLAAFGTRQVGKPEVLSLNGMIRKATKLIDAVTGEAIHVTVRTSPAAGRIRADATQMEQAIMTLVIHASTTMAGCGAILIETGDANIPSDGANASCAMLAITYSGSEPNPEKLFEPAAVGDDGLAMSMVHTIVAEHGGFVSAQRTVSAPGENGCRIEILLPREIDVAIAPQPSTAEAQAILLVENRDPIRTQLHNFFEANGYNLLEAADETEALAVAEMHEGRVDLVIADASLADALCGKLPARALRIVEGTEAGPDEIRRPFSQQFLLQKVEAMLRPYQELESVASSL